MKEQIFERFSPGTAYTENMTRLFPLLAGLLLFPVFQTEAAEKYSIIPEPEKTELKRNATRTLKLLSDKTSPALGKDAYRLAVTPQGVHLASGGREGRMYGLVTLQQLQDQRAAQPEGIPCGVITDKPRYPWRGMMVDPARHFIPIKDLKKFVDLMAYYKFNKLHVHLTDNQGWRLPVPGYPRLKSVASKREESFGDGIPHEGMYTRQELKDLVAYCAARGIEVIPEIDVPGHNQALAAAYPEFFCFPKPDMKVRTVAGNSKEAGGLEILRRRLQGTQGHLPVQYRSPGRRRSPHGTLEKMPPVPGSPDQGRHERRTGTNEGFLRQNDSPARQKRANAALLV